MRILFCGLALIAVIGLAGCGGGGGSSSTSSLTRVPADLVGTWRVPGLGLPNDSLGVQPSGDVVVYSESGTTRNGTRGDSYTKIGTCDTQGTLALNGVWRVSGADYSISAHGRLEQASHSITVQAVVLKNSAPFRSDDQPASGQWIGDDEYPPPPPPDVIDDPDVELPPPPPNDGGDDSDIEFPPPPPGDGPPNDGIELPPPPPSLS